MKNKTIKTEKQLLKIIAKSMNYNLYYIEGVISVFNRKRDNLIFNSDFLTIFYYDEKYLDGFRNYRTKYKLTRELFEKINNNDLNTNYDSAMEYAKKIGISQEDFLNNYFVEYVGCTLTFTKK